MDRRGFILTVLAGVAMPKVATALTQETRWTWLGGVGTGTSCAAVIGATGPSQFWLGPTGAPDPNFMRACRDRSDGWFRRNHGVIRVDFGQPYTRPPEYYYDAVNGWDHLGQFNIEKARAAWRANNIERGHDPEYCLEFLR